MWYYILCHSYWQTINFAFNLLVISGSLITFSEFFLIVYCDKINVVKLNNCYGELLVNQSDSKEVRIINMILSAEWFTETTHRGEIFTLHYLNLDCLLITWNRSIGVCHQKFTCQCIAIHLFFVVVISAADINTQMHCLRFWLLLIYYYYRQYHIKYRGVNTQDSFIHWNFIKTLKNINTLLCHRERTFKAHYHHSHFPEDIKPRKKLIKTHWTN